MGFCAYKSFLTAVICSSQGILEHEWKAVNLLLSFYHRIYIYAEITY